MQYLKMKRVLAGLCVAVSVLMMPAVTNVGYAEEAEPQPQPQVQLAPEYQNGIDEVCIMIVINEQTIIICLPVQELTGQQTGA